jgi:hypothetical protein
MRLTLHIKTFVFIVNRYSALIRRSSGRIRPPRTDRRTWTLPEESDMAAMQEIIASTDEDFFGIGDSSMQDYKTTLPGSQ